jgi:alpha-beta hydrolase superfamily lysophospholipase
MLMKEMVDIPIGKNWKLHGIVHLPCEVTERRVGVVVVAGAAPKFGARSVPLRVAEALAREGFFALRYDSRGTCDSEGIRELTFADRVGDVRTVTAVFRQRYNLDAVLGWSMCIGGAAALHGHEQAACPEETFDGLILCNLLAHPSQAKLLPQLTYGYLDIKTGAVNILRHESPLRKLWSVVRSHENWLKKGPTLIRRIVRTEPPLAELRKAVSRVGKLLARYERPTLLVFGEKDRYWTVFRDEVNSADCLGLANKKVPPAWAFVQNGDHGFSSREQTAQVLRYTLDWVRPFLTREGAGAGAICFGETALGCGPGVRPAEYT